jgi:hypothetical protein
MLWQSANQPQRRLLGWNLGGLVSLRSEFFSAAEVLKLFRWISAT